MNISLTATFGLAATVLAGVPAIGQAQVERQHAAHVHGEALGTLAVDGARLELELELPGYNLVGFEHAPRTPEQQAAMDSALEYLNGGAWLTSDAAGGCQVAEMDAHIHGFEDDDHGDDGAPEDHHDDDHHHDHEQDHDHNHDQDHDHEHDHATAEGHAEFHVMARLDCGSPERLGWVDLNLFDRFPGNEVLRLDVLTDRLATRLRLHAGLKRVELRADR